MDICRQVANGPLILVHGLWGTAVDFLWWGRQSSHSRKASDAQIITHCTYSSGLNCVVDIVPFNRESQVLISSHVRMEEPNYTVSVTNLDSSNSIRSVFPEIHEHQWPTDSNSKAWSPLTSWSNGVWKDHGSQVPNSLFSVVVSVFLQWGSLITDVSYVSSTLADVHYRDSIPRKSTALGAI